jgi:hypothetical protein
VEFRSWNSGWLLLVSVTMICTFKIDENNGVIETNGSLLDKYGRYKLRVNATDDGGLTGYTSVQIIVTDTNNNHPLFLVSLMCTVKVVVFVLRLLTSISLSFTVIVSV